MAQYNVWISNYNKPSDQLHAYSEKLIRSDYPSIAGKTIRVYVHSRPSALEDITEQLEELRSDNRLQKGDVISLREVFSGGDWKVEEAQVIHEASGEDASSRT